MAMWRTILRHVKLISLIYSPAIRSYPHPDPQSGSGWRAERAMASGFLAWMSEPSAAGGRDSDNRKRVLGPGPAPAKKCWEARRPGAGCPHRSDHAKPLTMLQMCRRAGPRGNAVGNRSGDFDGYVTLIRHPPLISFNNLALEHLYPHFIPHPRACSSSRPRLTARPRTPPRGRPGGLVAIGMEGSGRGPPTLIFPCDFFWSAENVGPGCDHCADWADQACDAAQC
jgi:hypothetical protein